MIGPQAQRPAHPIPIHRALRRCSTSVLVPVTAAAAVLAVLAASWLDPIGRARPRLRRPVGPVRVAGAALARGGMMADPIVRPAPAASAAPAGSIPIRTVPCATVEALVAQLAAQGLVHV